MAVTASTVNAEAPTLTIASVTKRDRTACSRHGFIDVSEHQRDERHVCRGDEQAGEEEQRGQFRAEDDRPAHRQRTQDTKVAFVGKQRVAHQQRDERDQEHRQADDQQVVAEKRAPVRLRRGGGRELGVLARKHPCQQKARAIKNTNSA